MKEYYRSDEMVEVAQGRQKIVFQCPDDETYLIKAIRPEYRHELETRFFYSKRYGAYMPLLRQFQEQLRIQWLTGQSPDFMERIVGFVETDLGVGMVVQCVKGEGESYGKSLKAMIEEGPLHPVQVAAVKRLVAWIQQYQPVIYDFSPGNILFQADNKPVLIDGIGASGAFSTRHLFSTYNAFKLRRKIARFERRLFGKVG